MTDGPYRDAIVKRDHPRAALVRGTAPSERLRVYSSNEGETVLEVRQSSIVWPGIVVVGIGFVATIVGGVTMVALAEALIYFAILLAVILSVQWAKPLEQVTIRPTGLVWTRPRAKITESFALEEIAHLTLDHDAKCLVLTMKDGRTQKIGEQADPEIPPLDDDGISWLRVQLREAIGRARQLR